MEERLRRAVGDPRVQIVSRMLQRRADGSKFPAQVASVSITRDARARRLAVVRDLTDLEIAEGSLRSLRTAAESAERAILILDRSRRIVFANAQASTLTGFSIEELHGQDPRLVAAKGFEDAWFRGLEQAASGKAWKGKVGLEGPGVSGRVVNVEIIPVTTIGGSVTHSVVALSDSTSGNPLQAAPAAPSPPKDAFVAYLADPVADALAAIQDLTEQVLASPDLSEELKPDVRAAFDQSTAALHLVREFEWVLGQHSEAGSPARGDIAKVLDDVILTADARMGERVLEARRDFRLDTVPIQAPVILREALLRILNHAVNNDPGNPVVIDITLVETVRNGHGSCRLRIASRGGPAEGEERARMFEMPRVAGPSGKPTREPALALSRILVELLGGTLHAENRVPSAPGEGTAYIVTLPTLLKSA
jgi:PAS domain S-box-containing protein